MPKCLKVCNLYIFQTAYASQWSAQRCGGTLRWCALSVYKHKIAKKYEDSSTRITTTKAYGK